MEKLMQYVWHHRLWPNRALVTTDGRPVSVIDQGRLNSGSGPDFFNAKVRIGDKMWVGDVEIHVRASDWHRHGHDLDKAYRSVILHVVDVDDCSISRHTGETIPQLRLPCQPQFYRTFESLVNRSCAELPCAEHLGCLDPIHVTDWLSSLAIERLYEKADRVLNVLHRSGGDWQQAMWLTLARAFGFGTNADPMERLAGALPLRLIYKHADNPLSVEALLLGQADLLDGAENVGEYGTRLISEYRFLAAKYGLRPMTSPNWRMGGMRPGNFPHRRIALLGALVAADYRLFDRLCSIATVDDAAEVFNVQMRGFWATHFSFARAEGRTSLPPQKLSDKTLALLIINVVVPLSVARGLQLDDDEAIERALDLLGALPGERNSVTAMFERAGLPSADAAASQALLRLRRAYCEQRKCLYCRFGHSLLSSRTLRHI